MLLKMRGLQTLFLNAWSFMNAISYRLSKAARNCLALGLISFHSLFACSANEQNTNPLSGNSSVQDASYFDFGSSFGSNIWSFIDYSSNPTGELVETKMSTYLNSLFQQMQGAGQQEILLAFAQLD